MSRETRYCDLTPDRKACLDAVAKAGGRTDHDDPILTPFCDDRSTLSAPDIFNQCHNAGWLFSTHDDRTDTAFVTLTSEGRAILSSESTP